MKALLARLYMTEAAAKAEGFTHHGRMFGVPVWIGALDTEGPMIATKFALLEHWLTVCTAIVQFMSAFHPDPPGFPLFIGEAIQ